MNLNENYKRNDEFYWMSVRFPHQYWLNKLPLRFRYKPFVWYIARILKTQLYKVINDDIKCILKLTLNTQERLSLKEYKREFDRIN
jgi:hypothetical protein